MPLRLAALCLIVAQLTACGGRDGSVTETVAMVTTEPVSAPLPESEPPSATPPAPVPAPAPAPVAAAAEGVVDAVSFGVASQDLSHGFSAGPTEVVIGALGQRARRSLPLPTPGIYGGDMAITSATDLVSRTSLSGPVTVAPRSTVVLDLVTPVDALPLPSTPLVLRSSVGDSGVTLQWTEASGAQRHEVSRSLTSGGPYSVLPAGAHLGTTRFTDTTATAGTTYYYVVTARNANGRSDVSMQSP